MLALIPIIGPILSIWIISMAHALSVVTIPVAAVPYVQMLIAAYIVIAF